MPQKQIEKKRTQKQAVPTSKSRKEKRANDANRKSKKQKKLQQKASRIRIFPIWLRLIIITILALFALAFGLIVGYGIIGDGEPLDALKVETWRHIIDIVVKE